MPDRASETRTFQLDHPPDDSAPCLVMIRGPQLGLRIQLASGDTVLGRGSQCGVVVTLDGVSRNTARSP